MSLKQQMLAVAFDRNQINNVELNFQQQLFQNPKNMFQIGFWLIFELELFSSSSTF